MVTMVDVRKDIKSYLEDMGQNPTDIIIDSYDDTNPNGWIIQGMFHSTDGSTHSYNATYDPNGRAVITLQAI